MPRSLQPTFRTTLFVAGTVGAVWAVAVGLFTTPFFQKHALYAHKLHTGYWYDVNKPEQWGFAKNQITPFNFSTPDGESLYAWHILPLGLYAKHETELVKEPSGLSEDIAKSKSFELLRDDPEARLIISFHGNAGNVAQGWRPDIYRTLSSGSTCSLHILAPDYRGFGLSTGIPSESGLIADGIATVNWALHTAHIPASRIVIVGHSLGTAVTAGTALHFARQGVEFAGVVLIAPFSDLPSLLMRYAPGGVLPLLRPLEWIRGLKEIFPNWIHHPWHTATRLSEFVTISKSGRLFIIHALDDREIPYIHSDVIFTKCVEALEPGLDVEGVEKLKGEGTVEMEGGERISTWKKGGKTVQEIVVGFGGHNRVMTFAPVALAVMKAFGMDEGELAVEANA